MAFFLLELPETGKTISHPIARQVARQVAVRLGIPKDTPIHTPSHLGSLSTPLPGEEQDRVGEDGLSGITITYREESDETALLASPFHTGQEHPPIFNDAALGVVVTPIYTKTTLSFTYQIRFRSKTEAAKFRDSARHRMQAMQRELKHTVDYVFLVPTQLLVLANDIHTRREAIAGYGEDWETYAKNHFTHRLKSLSNASGSSNTPAIGERQSDILGWWDFELAPEVETLVKAGDHWTLEFEYNISYDKPEAVGVHFPIQVHQQPLPDRWIGGLREPEPTEVDEVGYKSRTRTALDLFSKTLDHVPILSGVQIPHWMDWYPPMVRDETATVFTAMLQVLESDPTLLVDLTQLGDYEFTPAFRRYMSSECRHLNILRSAAITVELYKGNDPVDPTTISVGPDLVVRSTKPLDLRQTYYLRVCITTDLTRLTADASDALLHNPWAAEELLRTLCPELEEQGLFPVTLGDDYMSRSDYLRAVAYINTRLKNRRTLNEKFVGTVGHFFIGAYSNANQHTA